MRSGQELRELRGQPGLLAAFELGQDVLLGREVEVERAAGDAGLLGDDGHVRVSHAGPLELGDGSAVEPLASLQALRVPAGELVFGWHRALFLRCFTDNSQ